MSTQVTVTLRDEVYHRVDDLARLSGREVADLLADTIALSLPPLHPLPEFLIPVSSLSDEEVRALTELQLPPAEDQRLSELLSRQQAGSLTEADRSELVVLMQSYQANLLRKAQALREAVRRGLREPLEP